ncbi:hypothetical protein TD95_000942 [Thielaviopsis punctulata]|uniref:DBF4-type domain-containing protein n=1 Tax=Thielaviopsis punctulata TaxID=72032 RepID=A0A0F4ZFE0_9PEZI|nr:hypothetical protein TD95_000942 [Thielaviopsis punctulata]
MATRRTPLYDNPNAANSPLRGSSNLNFMKQKRSLATLQREDAYPAQPPSKRQMVDTISAPVPQRAASRNPRPLTTHTHAITRRERQDVAPTHRYSEKEKEDILMWQRQNRARFPRMVFFFESVASETKERLVRNITKLGAREAKFFSNDVTHVVTGRPIPTYTPPVATSHESHDQPQTINPSLMDRQQQDVRRRLFPDLVSKSSKSTRSHDVLIRAQEMNKKVYTVEKLHRILVNLIDFDISGSTRPSFNGGATIDQMIESERMARAYDMDKVNNEMHVLKSPFIYVYDIQERHKPIMVREYTPVADKRDGDWPQFRSVANGRCPFVEDTDTQALREARAARAKEREKEARLSRLSTAAPKLRPPKETYPDKSLVKRRRNDTDDTGTSDLHSARGVISRQTSFDKPSLAGKLFENLFTGKAPAGKLLAGEPVASGLQTTTLTSAIRSQMISSTSGTLGAKAGTSREILGLQRKVLKMSAPITSHYDNSSRRIATETSQEATSSRVPTKSGAEPSPEETTVQPKERSKSSLQKMQVPEKERHDPKPGFCENCQAKYRDFDDHVVTEKHRAFAQDPRNWAELDELLTLLARPPRRSDMQPQPQHPLESINHVHTQTQTQTQTQAQQQQQHHHQYKTNPGPDTQTTSAF